MQGTLEESAIQKKTVELCEAITGHADFKSLRSRVDGFLVNEAAKDQYNALVEQGQFLEHRQQTGTALTPADIADFEQKRDGALKNPVIHDFLQAQQEIQVIQKFVNDYVGKTFELGRTPTEEDFEEHGCGSGDCGCKH
jgi:cell fate (sporulation/competence/biofilm development) regulator YlbF (YheA/YmcA/DUF963 family)